MTDGYTDPARYATPPQPLPLDQTLLSSYLREMPPGTYHRHEDSLRTLWLNGNPFLSVQPGPSATYAQQEGCIAALVYLLNRRTP